MARKDLKGALGTSLKAEEQAVHDRFARAETVLARAEPTDARVAEPEATKVKRDSFTMPVTDHDLIKHLQKRCMKAEVGASKSEILRAGLAALSAMTDEELAAIVTRLERVKTGRRPQHTV